jgi:hypothetical protein
MVYQPLVMVLYFVVQSIMLLSAFYRQLDAILPDKFGCKTCPIVLRNRPKSRLRAPRLALERQLGRTISSGEEVRHFCNNPSCTNPAHLRLTVRGQRGVTLDEFFAFHAAIADSDGRRTAFR